MRRKKLLIIGIVITVILISGAYCLVPQKAEPLRLPDENDIVSFKLSHGNEATIIDDKSDIIQILDVMREARPTRIMSVNDTPSESSDYYKVVLSEIDHEQIEMYVYSDNNRAYVELPYQGVYKADTELLQMLERLVENRK